MDAEPITLQYSQSVKGQFKAVIGIVTLFICLMPWLHLFNIGWIQIFVVLDIMLILFYRYRICRVIEVSETGVSEFLGKQEWVWTWSEIHEISETKASQMSVSPRNRLVVEHKSTHDIAFDDQMEGYGRALELIQQNWVEKNGKKIDITHIPFFLLKFW